MPEPAAAMEPEPVAMPVEATALEAALIQGVSRFSLLLPAQV